jgi:hypothetical protein
MVEVGRISMAHGVRGELKVIPSTDFPEERFMTPGLRYIQAPMGTRKNITVPFKPVSPPASIVRNGGKIAQSTFLFFCENVFELDYAFIRWVLIRYENACGVLWLQVHLTGGRMMLNKGREMWLVKLKEVTSKEEVTPPFKIDFILFCLSFLRIIYSICY